MGWGMEGDLASSGGLLTTLTVAAASAVTLGITMVLKKFGIGPNDPALANNQAQKDMLDWQREQLRDEVQRREKAEGLVQTLLEKQNEMSSQMTRMELQNQGLQEQVQELTKMVEQLKAQMSGGRQ